MRKLRLFRLSGLLVFFIFFLAGCGGGGGGHSSAGVLTIGITDAPVDYADSVVIQFTGVEMHHSSGERLNFDFAAPRQIDLLSLTGGSREILLDEESVPGGRYNWLRLKVNAECDRLDSHIVIDGTMFPLWIPSGSQTGLKLVQGFSVPEGGRADFTIDFDLRKSVNFPQGKGSCSGSYRLKPALRIVDNSGQGSIAGTVHHSLIMAPSCEGNGAVYVFQGHDIVPDDMDGSDPEPVASGKVKFDGDTGDYVYQVSFLNPGDHTVTYTCQAERDDPESDDAITFTGTSNVTVTAGGVTRYDFQ